MRLLALDQASKTSGYAVFIDGKLEDYGKFTFEDVEIGDRLHKIREKVAELIANYGIDYVAFEDIQLQQNVQNNVQTFKVLAEDVSGSDDNFITGRLTDNSLVHFEADKSVIGNIVDVEITDCKTFYLIGKLI